MGIGAECLGSRFGDVGRLPTKGGLGNLRFND